MAGDMSDSPDPVSSSRRDRSLRRVRRVTLAIAAATAGLATTLSVVAAHAFKGHARQTGQDTALVTKRPPERRLVVPPPQRVPPISSSGESLQPPSAPPSSPAPQPASPQPAPAPPPAPQTSGGS
jgi:hypothetical protein